ncbi:MAG: Sec-independent protein translocase subunit TatB [Actinophytocola sp.]|nr:Sec-independent protein translocase subunit TatB [Actinophytocola sp.]
MFDSIGMWEILVLIIAALFILGPERLPDAMSWVGRSVRKVRDFATSARDQMRKEMGPEFDEFRKPIEDLRSLRSFDPKRAVTQHLFDGDKDPFGMDDLSDEPKGPQRTNGAASERKVSEPLTPGEKPPVDPDAT